MMTFELFVWLMIFAHFIGDYVLRSNYLSETKGKEWYNMLVHCVLYSGSVVWVLVSWINAFPYLGLVCLLVSHWFIDRWKCRKLEKQNEMSASWERKLNEKRYLYKDQSLHLVVLVGLILWYK